MRSRNWWTHSPIVKSLINPPMGAVARHFYCLVLVLASGWLSPLWGQSLTDRLLGEWERFDDGRTKWMEIWEAPSGRLTGKGIQVVGQDTLIQEYLSISTSGKKTVYSARVPGQNKGKTIRFPLAQSGTHFFRFENPRHDFPQVMQYTFLNGGEMEVLIANLENGVARREIKFYFRKVN